MFVEELCSGTLSFTVSETIYVTSSRCFARITSTHFIDLFIGEKYRVYDPGRRQVAQHKPQPLIKPLYYLVHYRCFLIGGSVHLKKQFTHKNKCHGGAAAWHHAWSAALIWMSTATSTTEDDSRLCWAVPECFWGQPGTFSSRVCRDRTRCSYRGLGTATACVFAATETGSDFKLKHQTSVFFVLEPKNFVTREQ